MPQTGGAINRPKKRAVKAPAMKKLGLPTLKQVQKGKLAVKKNARIERAYRVDAKNRKRTK